jgi:hypothetical protein
MKSSWPACAGARAIDVNRINTVMAYYGEFSEEIDAEIEAADAASLAAERAWRIQQRLVA